MALDRYTGEQVYLSGAKEVWGGDGKEVSVLTGLYKVVLVGGEIKKKVWNSGMDDKPSRRMIAAATKFYDTYVWGS